MEKMKAKLEESKGRKKSTPTEALLEPFNDGESDNEKEEKKGIEPKKKDESTLPSKSVDDKFESLTVKKKKMEDTHKRKTFLVDKKLIERLNKLAKNKHHGFQTEFINVVIEYGLKRME